LVGSDYYITKKKLKKLSYFRAKSPCKNLEIFIDSQKIELTNLSVQDRFGLVKERQPSRSVVKKALKHQKFG
jgi:hypothetical protein